MSHLFSLSLFVLPIVISLEAWRGGIGVWSGGRVKQSSNVSSPKLNVSQVQSLNILWGIATLLVAAVICMLLIIGGVRVNPGPPRMDFTSSPEEEIDVPKSFDFGDSEKGIFVFSAPVTPKMRITKRRVQEGSKKRPKFGGHINRDKVTLAHEYFPVPTTYIQTSVTESHDVLELSAKVPRISVETQNEIIPFFDILEHQETLLPESQPKLTTAQTIISKWIVEDF